MSPDIIRLILQATADTLTMVAVAAGIGTLLGLPLGVFLATSKRGELFAAPFANAVLGALVNATRSTPFIILVVAIIPFTRLLAGTSICTAAAIVPLTVGIAGCVAGAPRRDTPHRRRPAPARPGSPMVWGAPRGRPPAGGGAWGGGGLFPASTASTSWRGGWPVMSW